MLAVALFAIMITEISFIRNPTRAARKKKMRRANTTSTATSASMSSYDHQQCSLARIAAALVASASTVSLLRHSFLTFPPQPLQFALNADCSSRLSSRRVWRSNHYVLVQLGDVVNGTHGWEEGGWTCPICRRWRLHFSLMLLALSAAGQRSRRSALSRRLYSVYVTFSRACLLAAATALKPPSLPDAQAVLLLHARLLPLSQVPGASPRRPAAASPVRGVGGVALRPVVGRGLLAIAAGQLALWGRPAVSSRRPECRDPSRAGCGVLRELLRSRRSILQPSTNATTWRRKRIAAARRGRRRWAAARGFRFWRTGASGRTRGPGARFRPAHEASARARAHAPLPPPPLGAPTVMVRVVGGGRHCKAYRYRRRRAEISAQKHGAAPAPAPAMVPPPTTAPDHILH